MHRVLLLDADHPGRTLLVDSIQHTANASCVVAAGPADVVAQLGAHAFAAVFIDAALLGNATQAVLTAIHSAAHRPLVVFASNDDPAALDPELISLIVRKPYDVPTVTGILLSAILEMPSPGAIASQRPDRDA